MKQSHLQTPFPNFLCIIVFAMVLFIPKLNHFYSKLENCHHHHHNHQSQALSASLEAFQSHVSNCLNKLSLNSKSAGSEILSFPWIQQCFELISIVNNAFAKLVVAIDYPMSKWEAASVDEYLKYSLNLLELCNSISSSLSHLGKARVSLAHGLSLVESSSPSLALEHLKAIQPKGLNRGFGFQGNEEVGKERCLISKEAVVHQALVVMQSMVLWVSGILMSGLVGEAKPYLEMRSSAGRLVHSSLSGLDLSIGEVIVKRNGVLKEVKELNEASAGLVAAIEIGKGSDEAAEKLRKRLEAFEKFVEGLGKEVDCLFNKVLAGRNQLLNGLRQQRR